MSKIIYSNNWSFRKRSIIITNLALSFIFLIAPIAYAQTDIYKVLETPFYDPGSISNCSVDNPSGASAGSLVWPFNKKSSTQYNRVDQGWDVQAEAGASIYAIAPGTIHEYAPNPGGFGNDYPTEQLDASIGGTTNWVYYGHVHVLPQVINMHVQAGQKIAIANSTDPQNGSLAPPGWLEIGFASPGEDAPVDTSSSPDTAATPAGQKMKDLLISAQPINGSVIPSDSSGGCACVSVGAAGNPAGTPTQAQVQIAKTIMGIVKSDNLGQNAAVIALMTALDESTLQIYSNSNVPVSLSNPAATIVGSDHNSVGVFQQQPDTGWSTIATGSAALSNKAAVWQDMDPAFSAEAFLGTPPGVKLPKGLVNPSALTKGLQNIPNWQSLPPWEAAQQVQHSGTSSGLNYKQQLSQAQSLISKYWAAADPVPLPIPLTGGSASNSAGFSC